MGRKFGEVILIIGSLIFFGLIFAASSVAYATDTSASNLRIFVHMQPEKANSSDFEFWEGGDVRVKLEMYDVRDNNFAIDQTHPPTKLIDFKASGFKILYVWDSLDTAKVIEYRDAFQPLEGQHWLFAYAVNNDGIYQTPATKFLIQYSSSKKNSVIKSENVYVSGEYVKWGSAKQNSLDIDKTYKSGQITEEATSTSKILTPIPTQTSNDVFKNLVIQIFSGNFNIWIVLLIVGIILLVVAKLFLKKGKNE